MGNIEEKLSLSEQLFEIDRPIYYRLNFAQFDYSQSKSLEELRRDWKQHLITITEPIDFYLHIPFCHLKCKYCQYSSIPTVKQNSIESYFDYLIHYLDFFKETFEHTKFRHLYIGGGTPNTLSDQQIDLLLTKIFENYSFLEGSHQHNFELHPNITTKTQLEILKKHGINRISFGLESFNETTIERYGRIYTTPSKVKQIVAWSNELGFKEMNVNLLIGLDGETQVDVIRSANILCEAGPTSIRLYTLQENVGKSSWYNQNNDYYSAVTKTYESLLPIFKRFGYNGSLQYDKIEVGQSFIKGDPAFSSDYEVFGLMNNSLFAIGYQSYGVISGKLRYKNSSILKNFSQSAKSIAYTNLSLQDQVGLYLIRQLQTGKIDTEETNKEYPQAIEKFFINEIQYLVNNNLLIKDSSYVSKSFSKSTEILQWNPNISLDQRCILSSIFLSTIKLRQLLNSKQLGENRHNRDWTPIEQHLQKEKFLKRFNSLDKNTTYQLNSVKTVGNKIFLKYQSSQEKSPFIVTVSTEEQDYFKNLGKGYFLSYLGNTINDSQTQLLEQL